MKPQYRKGPEVAREFEDALRKVFQTPKPEREEEQPKSATSHKPKQPDRG